MKNLKLSRNLWLFSGFCFLISFMLNVSDKKSTPSIVLSMIASILMFINAYINHKKIINNDKNKTNND
ncbi:hypothetical protein NBE98_22285 [Clostridium swellfunianum]|uniref:hypothetical protein n=1 Tax=Clostridium swellfunianum TaxID=1367462 RepID=UPI002030E29A|nr:hypothetical protein [Clostridium swellfunianum]MCM0651091.1 hypothetical protein [Clostridium swellfunianum]